MNIEDLTEFQSGYGGNEATEVIENVIRKNASVCLSLPKQELNYPMWSVLADRSRVFDEERICLCVGDFLINVWNDGFIHVEKSENLNIRFYDNTPLFCRYTRIFMPITFGKNLVQSKNGEVLFKKAVNNKIMSFVLAGNLDGAVRLVIEVLNREDL